MKKTDLPTVVGFIVMALFLFCVSATISARPYPLPAFIPATPLRADSDGIPGVFLSDGPSALKNGLAPARLAAMSVAETRAAAELWFEKAAESGIEGRESFALVMPDNDFYMARLSDEDTRNDIKDLADGDSPIALRYARILSMIPEAEKIAARYETIAETWWKLDARAAAPVSRPVAPFRKSQAIVPTKASLRQAHQDALDVFFAEVERDGVIEKGPDIRSMTDGVVVAASIDWLGDDTPEGYVSGGISPRAGNGAIVYNPAERRYYLYFHFSSTFKAASELVKAGELLGRGGNSGYNARKDGHGEHVHLEIYDAAQNRSFSSTKIRSYILSLM
ncbi:MAG: M23 family metallopeptidase [Spirochaetes bacterium]|nr:M23 family metallopeptidase [Spirochaetota bacterium]